MNDNIILDDLIGKVSDDAWVEGDEMKKYLVDSIEMNAEELLDITREQRRRNEQKFLVERKGEKNEA